MKRFVTFGETLAQYNAEFIGRYGDDGDYLLDCAGAESNVAVDLQRLSVPELTTTWVSRLGDDEAGDFILRTLEGRTNVEAKKYTGETTALSYLNHHPDGQHIKTYFRKGSAASKMCFADIEPYLDGADLLHVTGITPALSAECRTTMTEALKYADSKSIPVSFDLNYREQLWSPPEARPVFEGMIRSSSLFKVGHDEAEQIWAKGWDAGKYCDFFQKMNGGLVVVTRADAGAIACDGSQLIEHKGFRVEVVDPVGAGDAFVAGLLAAILAENTIEGLLRLESEKRRPIIERALSVANACGALTCTRRGDTAAMPTMDEVEDFIKRH